MAEWELLLIPDPVSHLALPSVHVSVMYLDVTMRLNGTSAGGTDQDIVHQLAPGSAQAESSHCSRRLQARPARTQETPGLGGHGDRGHYAKVMWPGSGPSSAHISHLSLCGDRELSQCFLFVVIIVQRPFPLIFTLSAQGGFSPRCLHPYQGGRDTQYAQHVGGFKKWKETIFQTGLLMAIQREASPARPGSAWG